MRLLLLLSALFASLVGVVGTRGQAQPVQASAMAIAPAAAAVARPVAALSIARPAFAAMPPAGRALPDLMAAAARRLLYAERRRE